MSSSGIGAPRQPALAVALLAIVSNALPPAVAAGAGETDPRAPAAVPAPAPAIGDAAVYCTACGARSKAGSRFCMRDGAALPTLETARFARGFVRAPETLSAEEVQQNVQAATRAIVRIRVKTTTPLKIPVTQREQEQGFEFIRAAAFRVDVGRLETLEESAFAGSGFVISPAGEIVTNAHVASPFGMQGTITIETREGRSHPARLVGIDRASDLAVLSAPGLGLPHLEWGDSNEIRLGEEGWALGNPLDIGISITRGTLATRARTRAGVNQVESYIHSDAHITHGNSGGPLVNAAGEVIGVSDIGLGPAKGQGYSIASSVARLVTDRLIRHGKYERGFLGVHASLVDAAAIKRFNLKVRGGLVVESVLPGTPAATAGFQRGDVLYGINGRQATSAYLFQEAVSSVGPGVGLRIAVNRDGAAREIAVTTALRPEEPRIDPVADLEHQMFVRFEEDPKAKRVVIRIPDQFSPAPRHGFLEGSIIESVVPAQDWPEEPLTFDLYKKKMRPIRVTDLADLREALGRAYLAGRIAVAFEMRRVRDPIAAVAYDETWAIVI